MIEKFNVVRVRFHIEDKQILVIQGWKHDMKPEDELEVTLDGEKLPWVMETYDGMEVRQRYMIYDLGIEEEYYLYVTLPEDFDRKKELALWVITNSRVEQKKHSVYQEKAASLKKLQGEIDFFLEQVTLKKEQCYLKGWAASAIPITIKVKGGGGKEIEAKASFHERRDVSQIYRETEQMPDSGFEVALPHRGMSAVTLEITNGICTSRVKVPIVSTFFFENMLGNSYLGKGARFLQHHGWKQFCARTMQVIAQKSTPQGDYEKYRQAVAPTEEELKRQRNEQFAYAPLVSVVVPLYKTPIKYLEKLVESVQKQTYANWELCLSDGSGESSPLEKYLKKLEKQEKRVKVIRNSAPLRISENTNAALAAAKGDYVAFADHDDLLAEDALYECVKVLQERPETELIYTDEDKISINGKHYFQPHFKSDYNPDLLCSMNYFCHLVVVKKDLLERAGWLNGEFDGAQDYDFVLRCCEQTNEIYHIPRVLYHWRAHENSTSENPESKKYAFEAGKRAVQAHLDRLQIPAKVEMGEYPGLYRVHYQWKEQPLVSILIPNKDHTEDLDKCIRSVEEQSSYRNYEYIVIENNSELPETFDYYKKLEAENEKVRVVYWEKEFNFAAINNFGAEFARGEYLLLLNNDTEMIGKDCLWELLGPCMREDVGITGARLYYEDGTIQHAGVVIGFGGIAGHAFIGFDGKANGYFSRIICAQNYSAVTAACMMTKKSVFEQVGGLTEELVVAFNDIDYCMKVKKFGKLIVYNPYAELYHYESKSRGLEDSPQKQERYYKEMKYFVTRWQSFMDQGDPYYNPNLTLSKADFSLRQV
ncbi:glycosyltransferase family 2 protein [Petralouisia muris]|uniref:Glycosyltransferase family 2 protein n=1 Tax=Petralouisia muris TaxID=3032872 RepID=A0AC61RV19_9FIRM|nr:glycosyltransferase family 2 protein [Petralouisia muris]TGY95789.1 glycosyltransferase family 2 protein [Petralouisia muris]